jgi:arylsulfatase
MSADVEIPVGNAEGVLGTMGGRFGGWALLVRNGKPEFVFAYSNQPQDKYRITSSETLSPGKHTIEFDFKYDGGGIGGWNRDAQRGRQTNRARAHRKHDPGAVLV